MNNNKYVVLVIFILIGTIAHAQAPGFVDDVEDTAPIPGLLLAVCAAIGIGVAKLRSKK
ncbi:hypothetical protein [uncultured Nonlabens sp.]|uniref:hypothetical protein n=1 Tax=uncultured Nonlabens sp. TaxID=859306 RepID=UPI00263557A2|nr:hypothetical protein [uncultured Nonlabens sp.]